MSVILVEQGKLYGIVQAVNKLPSKATGGREAPAGFSSDDEKLLRMVASHIAIFVDAVMAGG